MSIVPHIEKGARHTIGSRIENKFLDILECAYVAYFTERYRKAQKITECILIADTLKFFMYVAWEGKFISHKQYGDAACSLDEIGKMLGGWRRSLTNPEKKNRDM